ncbi:hypothetical protein SAMN06265379_101649 [Saccharicrinis carchari]|uniref:Uncharacterized protein n=1 Tax=Saccharicrinis carchari TaxID=1168039 RepID=A0A521B373_SACCC|nr:hypothetical protein [Saccharicrinis carchari]SMO41533.1 hypothetical protein SAMN06265379_101649 [Saccharicrinis carchari]
MKITFTLLYTLLITTCALAQNSPQIFSENTEEFVSTLDELFKSVSDKKYAKQFIEEVDVFWQSTELSEENKKIILNNCHLLAQKRARPLPDYETYLNTVRHFILSEIPPSSFNAWNQAVTEMIKKPRLPLRKVNTFLRTTCDLLTQNIIFSTRSNRWKTDNNNWTLTYANGDLVATFPNLNLTCLSKNDSIQIYDSKGSFNYTSNVWQGIKGKVTWERSGFDPEKVYALFKHFEIPFDHSYFEIDSVQFYNSIYFDHPLQGKLRHKVMNINSPKSSTYPQFTSSEQRFKLDNIHPSINYEGGFSQNGAKFLGSGTHDNPATITIFRNDTVFLTAKSLYFALRKEQILSNETEVKIRLDTGYIYHPGLIFKLMVKENELHLIRNGEGLALSPYFNTYHNVSMDIELLTWKINSRKIDLKMISGAAENHGEFESLSYFRESFYNFLQGMDAIHPLQGLKNCARLYKSNTFLASEYAHMMRLPINEIRQQVIQLSFYGFVGYNINTDQIEIRQRLEDYLLFRLGKKDYDVIRFNSNTPGNMVNGQIDLLNYDISINGVKNISISDNQNVVFFPAGEHILLKRNRNFIFDGAINAGMLNLYGKGFKFDYDQFLIDMSNIDSVRMKVQTGDLDYFGQPKMTYVKNAIENLSGSLMIDRPDNKSGKEQYSRYPILNSSTESYVYYDKPEVQMGQYNREKFYFKLDTFTMDSISRLSAKNFDFSGSFVSNIFPTFNENITVRNDYSLGFKRKTPEEGYGIYDNKAKFIADIDLSNAGLKGSGTLKYLTSTTQSENLLFLPESTSGQAYQFTVEKKSEGVEYPDAQGKYSRINYLPYQDRLIATTQEEAFTMYNNEAQLEGEIEISPTGASGDGTFYMDRANIFSPAMTFGGHTVLADSSDFNLVSTDMQEGVSFNTTNLISHIDFVSRQGKFNSKTGGSRVNFSDNRYISYISEFSWNMDNNNIYMGASGSKGNRFVSTHRRQDSLEFMAPLARYDVEKKIIYAEEVKNIMVADANIKLKDGKVTIHEDAEMAAIDSASITLAGDSAFSHSIYNARLKIAGKYDYTGYGEYDYINGDGKKFTLQFNDIRLNDDAITTAEGTIVESDLFTFDKNFTFKGKAHLNATQKNLSFDGGVQMLHHCANGPQTYTYFNTEIDPHNILIPIGKEPVNFERNNIYKDFFITKDSSHVYSTFLASRKDYSDIPMITAGEYLYFNESLNAFEIADMPKILNPDTTGVLFRYSNSNCDLLAEGKMNLGIELDGIRLSTSGSIIDDPKKDQIMLSTLMGIDFFFNETCTEQMISAVLASTAAQSRQSDQGLAKRMAELIGPALTQEVLNTRNEGKQNDDLNHVLGNILLFGNIDFKFDGPAHAYIADGKADLTFIRNKAVNKIVDVKAEIVKKRSGNSIDLFLSFDKNTWFYFSYKSKMMYTLSSNEEYNNTVRKLSSDERKAKSGGFSFIAAPASRLNRFIKKFGLSPIKTSAAAEGQAIDLEAEVEAPTREE